MKTDYPGLLTSGSVALGLIWIFSCSGRPGRETETRVQAPEVPEDRVEVTMVSPAENTSFTLHEAIRIELGVPGGRKPDSIVISFDGRRIAALSSEPWEYTIPPAFTGKTGRRSLKVTAWEGNRKPGTVTRFMIIRSDVAPKNYGYRIVHTYPHDREAFTQGLFFHGGVMYEGTGQESGSTLREVELETGKVLRQHNLEASLFGEGITLYNDRIYQVTWENKVGFVYDRATFRLLNKFFYPTQGWGLATFDNRIVMSDGSNVLYFFEPDNFTVVSRLEVYDNRNLVDSLNELEVINGEIWANVWMTDRIARIDPESGKVKGYIDLKGLLKQSDRLPDTDVLNGIAWDAAANRIFVTGKRWPKLFEIKVTE